MNDRLVLVLFFSMALAPLVRGEESPAGKFDVIIKGGTVYDGTGGKGRVIDVALRGDRIAGVGTFAADQAPGTTSRRLARRNCAKSFAGWLKP